MKTRYAHPMPPAPMQVIPAAPGFFVICQVHDADRPDAEPEYSKDPIVGWAIDREFHQPYPITLYGLDAETPSILKPDGTIDRLGMESYDSIDQWLADLKRTSKESNV